MPDNVPAVKEGSAVAPRVSSSFKGWLEQLAEQNTGSQRSFEVAANQLDAMFAAESLDDIMDADTGGTHQGRDLVDLEMEVQPFDWHSSVSTSSDEYETPLGVYITFPAIALADHEDAGIKAGEELLISTGAPLVIGKLRALDAAGYLPMELKIVGIKAGKGTVLKLARVPKRVTKA